MARIVKQSSTAAALKAERQRDMAQALRDYKDEQDARRINMGRLRALRLANERAPSSTGRATKKSLDRRYAT